MSFVQNFISLAQKNTVFSLEYIDELRRELQKVEGQDLLIIENSKKLSIRCSNDAIGACQFAYKFNKKYDIESKEIGLQFICRSIIHNEECKVNNEQESFKRNSLLIESNKLTFANFMMTRYQKFGPESPNKLLQVFSQELQFSETFIYKGLVDGLLRRKIKKKFDNLISEIRLKLKIPISRHPLNKSKQKKQRRKMSLKLKEFHNCEEEEQKAIEDFFISESSEEESEFLFERLAQTPRRIQMKLRKHKFTQNQEQNPEVHSYEYTENTSPRLQNLEALETQRKRIKKV